MYRLQSIAFDLHAIAGRATYSKGNLTRFSRGGRGGKGGRKQRTRYAIDAIKRNRSNYELILALRPEARVVFSYSLSVVANAGKVFAG